MPGIKINGLIGAIDIHEEVLGRKINGLIGAIDIHEEVLGRKIDVKIYDGNCVLGGIIARSDEAAYAYFDSFHCAANCVISVIRNNCFKEKNKETGVAFGLHIIGLGIDEKLIDLICSEIEEFHCTDDITNILRKHCEKRSKEH